MNKRPTESGWYWFKISPHTDFIPAHVFEDGRHKQLYYNTVLGQEGQLVYTTWPMQWGPKIEEPKL
jgi:hypothetical protein